MPPQHKGKTWCGDFLHAVRCLPESEQGFDVEQEGITFLVDNGKLNITADVAAGAWTVAVSTNVWCRVGWGSTNAPSFSPAPLLQQQQHLACFSFSIVALYRRQAWIILNHSFCLFLPQKRVIRFSPDRV